MHPRCLWSQARKAQERLTKQLNADKLSHVMVEKSLRHQLQHEHSRLDSDVEQLKAAQQAARNEAVTRSSALSEVSSQMRDYKEQARVGRRFVAAA